ncbi:Polyamine oxidase 1-like protein [Drosera capensis]
MEVAETVDEMGAKLSKYWASKPGRGIEMRRYSNFQTELNGVCTHHSIGMVIDYFYHDYEDSEPRRITGLKHTLPRCAKEDFGTDAHFVADPRGLEAVVHHIAKQFISYKGQDITDHRIKLNQEWKEQAITEFSMGTFAKIFLQFPYRFWPTGPGTEFFLYAHHRRGYYPVWQCNSMTATWPLDFFGKMLHLENEMPGANILFVFMKHEESARIEQQSHNETIAEVMQVLHKMFGDDIPEPSRIFIPRWKSDRFYRVAYSNWPNGYSEERHEQLCVSTIIIKRDAVSNQKFFNLILYEPVGPVHFTGEHTNVPYLGYADGAYLAAILLPLSQ